MNCSRRPWRARLLARETTPTFLSPPSARASARRAPSHCTALHERYRGGKAGPQPPGMVLEGRVALQAQGLACWGLRLSAVVSAPAAVRFALSQTNKFCPAPACRFKVGASQMMGTNPMEGITSLSQVHVRQERAPQHQRPLLGQTYAPSPAPGETINILRKRILKQNGEGERTAQDLNASLLGTSLSSSPQLRIGTSGSNSVKFLDSEKRDRNEIPSWLGAEALERNRKLDCPDPVTPRGQWRKQVRVKHKSLSPAAVALGEAAHNL